MTRANPNHDPYPDPKIFKLDRRTLIAEMLPGGGNDKQPVASILRLTAMFEDGTSHWVQFEYASRAVVEANFQRFDEREAEYWWGNLYGAYTQAQKK